MTSPLISTPGIFPDCASPISHSFLSLGFTVASVAAAWLSASPTSKRSAAMRMGIEIATILEKLYPTNFDPAKLLVLVGNAETIASCKKATSPEQIVDSWSTNLTSFDALRRKYFLYK